MCGENISRIVAKYSNHDAKQAVCARSTKAALYVIESFSYKENMRAYAFQHLSVHVMMNTRREHDDSAMKTAVPQAQRGCGTDRKGARVSGTEWRALRERERKIAKIENYRKCNNRMVKRIAISYDEMKMSWFLHRNIN